MRRALALTREQILAFRRRVGALDERLPPGPESLRQAAWAGLQDSMPRAAVLSIHARVAGTEPSTWEDPSLVQLWGPRYQVYVVARPDLPVFSVGRLPDDEKGRLRAHEAAARLLPYLGGAGIGYGDAGRALGVHHNSLRYGATTGTIVVRWDGARQPEITIVAPPQVDPLEARLELARRHLRVFGPSTSRSLTRWAGVSARAAAAAFEALAGSLTQVRTPLGDAWILTSDEPLCRADPRPAAAARLLPSGDAYYLLWGDDRALLVPQADRRGELWTPRVWPGAIMLDGEIRGTWRRARNVFSMQAWDAFSPAERDAVEAEAASLPLPGVEGGVVVGWDA